MIKFYDINIYIVGLLISEYQSGLLGLLLLCADQDGSLSLSLSSTDTRDIYDVGCLIDHHRPNQVNFYTRIRLVLVGFCHPAIPQSIEEDKALGTEKSSTQPVTTSTRLSSASDKFVPNSRRQSGSGKAVLSPGLPSH